MAIQKSKTLQNGATGDYWRLLNITIDRTTFKASCQLALFKDAATSNSGAPHLGDVKTFHFSFTMGEISAASNIVAYIYAKIVAAAEAEVTTDKFGNQLESPQPFDIDLAGGINV
jgi:hypothetical protein